MKKTPWLGRIIMLILFILFVVSAYKVLDYTIKSRNEERAFKQLEEIAGISSPTVLDGNPLRQSDQETAESGVLSGYEALKEKNGDFFGWVSIDGTELNYPVMYTPEEPEYYLRRAFDGSDSMSGVPFLDASCFTGCGNYLIYAHNMKNGSMFSTLLSYAEREYWEQHPLIHFDTLDEKGEYAVLAAFYSEVYKQNGKNVFRYYQYTDLRDEAVFSDYLRRVHDNALYDTGVTAAYGDQLLTLSTCSYHVENGRFVVIARKTYD